MRILWPWLLVAQAWTWPAFVDGGEVRVVSPDLVQVYAVGTVVPDELRLRGSLPAAGTPLRILLFPVDEVDGREGRPEGGPADVGAGAPRVVRAVVRAVAGADHEVWLISDDGGLERGLTELLRASGRTLAWLEGP